MDERFPPSEVRGIGTEKNNRSKGEKGKEINEDRSSDSEVKLKAGLCEGSVKAVAMGAQQVINPDNIGEGSFELKGDKGVANHEGFICESICEEKYTIGTLMGCEKQLTVNRESFRNHTMSEIAGQLNGGNENMCKADVREGLGDGLAMRLPLSESREIYKDSLETDNMSNIGSKFNSEMDLPGKRDHSTIYRLNLIKLYRRKRELANLFKENSSEGIVKDSEIICSVKLFMDIDLLGILREIQLYFKLPPDRSSYLRMINSKKKEEFPPDPGTIRWRDGQVCPYAAQGIMAPWARRPGCVLVCYAQIGRGRPRETFVTCQ
ncbi:uncharacterized protein TNCV_184181 [Trichonephila clavipes]|nr:uncharacterized protein TNCV_184181 [Trichonephila clavipes]